MDFSFNEITRIIELFISFIGLGLILFGWLMPYTQSRKANIDNQKFEQKMLSARWEKELIDEQISKFYSPISELLNELEIRFSLVTRQLNRKSIFNDNRTKLSELPENEQKIWVHFVQTYSIPIQSRILEIIQKNLHLAYNFEIPISLYTFMEYIIGWEYFDNQKKSDINNYFEYYYSFNFPKSFKNEINNSLAILNKRKTELIKLYID